MAEFYEEEVPNKKEDVQHQTHIIDNFLEQLVNPKEIYEILQTTRSDYTILRRAKAYRDLPEIYDIFEWMETCLNCESKSPKHKEVMDYISEKNNYSHVRYLQDLNLVKTLSDLGISFSRGRTDLDQLIAVFESKKIPVGIVTRKLNKVKVGHHRFIPAKFELTAQEVWREYKLRLKSANKFEG